MNEQIDDIRNKLIEKILRRKFDTHYSWAKPKIQQTVGPYSPLVFDTYTDLRSAAFETGTKWLEVRSDSELNAIQGRESDNEQRILDEWRALLDSEISQLHRCKPSWAAGGFGHPNFVADFHYWGQMAEYTIHEGLLLTVGIEPKHIGEKVLEGKAKDVDKGRLLPTFEYLVKRREQFRRHFRRGMEGWYRIRPYELKLWIDDIQLEVHEDFYAELERRYPVKSNVIPIKKVQQLSSQERDSLLTLVAAMACEQYGYNPSTKRNSATSSIGEDIATVGLNLDDSTILKWLKEAATLVPREYWDK